MITEENEKKRHCLKQVSHGNWERYCYLHSKLPASKSIKGSFEAGIPVERPNHIHGWGAFSSPAQSNLDLPSLTFPAAEGVFQATAKNLDETAILLPLLWYKLQGRSQLVQPLENGASDGNGNHLKPISNQPPSNVGYGFRFPWYCAGRRNRGSTKDAMK